MNNTSKVLSIIAYYLSEYDMKAVKELGFKNRTEAFKKISVIFDRDNNYLKLRRDEFDALPDSSSSRNGWKNREPARDVSELANYLKDFTFEELTEMVHSLIDNVTISEKNEDIKDEEINAMSEQEIEQIINAKDPSATIRYRTNLSTVRVYKHSIIKGLKKLYKGKCQICGDYPIDNFKVDICEAHHIEFFSHGMNNDSSNILIICPNHHTLIHKLSPVFNAEKMQYEFSDGTVQKIKLDYHIK